jgi:hypothetical protein
VSDIFRGNALRLLAPHLAVRTDKH